MNSNKLVRFGLVFALALSVFALAQTKVQLQGTDTAVTPNLLRNVVVDSQGRLIVSSTSSSDGGTSAGTTASYPAPCSDTRQVPVTLSAGVATSFGTTGLLWLRVCNSLRNSGNPLITCASDSHAPTTAATGYGDVLAPGDCVTVPANPNGLSCISDATVYVNQMRCYQ